MKKNCFENKLNIFFFLIFILFVSPTNAQESKNLISAVLTETTDKTRGIIKEDEGAYRLDYDDVYEQDTQAKYLQGMGFHGGGPSWLGIIHGAFSICESDLVTNLDSDVSVTGVSFWSEQKEDLEKISRVIALIKSDNKILLEAIEIAKKQELML